MKYVEHSAVLDAGRVSFLIIYDLSVISIDLGYSQCHLGCSQVNRDYMSFVHFHDKPFFIISLFYILSGP